MAHFDLEEQEQLDQLKHFWSRYGNLITWTLIGVLGLLAAWNGWQYWQRRQAAQAVVLYEEIDRAARSGEMPRVEQALADMRERFGRTVYAQQAALVAAQALADAGKADSARAALTWVAEKSPEAGYRAVAQLRLAALHIQSRTYDEALRWLGNVPPPFDALAADRRGDVYLQQGKPEQAKAEYRKAFDQLQPELEYRRLVEVKLQALGVNPAPVAAPASAPAGAA